MFILLPLADASIAFEVYNVIETLSVPGALTCFRHPKVPAETIRLCYSKIYYPNWIYYACHTCTPEPHHANAVWRLLPGVEVGIY